MECNCEYCHSPFVCRQRRRFCSQTCSNRAHAAPAEQNPNYKPGIEKACETCGKSIIVKPGVINRKKFCSVQCRIDYTRTLTGNNRYNHKSDPKEMACEICGKKVLVRHSLQKRFRACSKRCASEIGRRVWPRTSSLEVLMFDVLTTAGLVVLPQYPIDFYTVDFAVLDEQIAIECDGDYWHGRPLQQAKDHQKDGYLKRKGWTIIRLPETDIHSDIQSCVARIMTIIQTKRMGQTLEHN